MGICLFGCVVLSLSWINVIYIIEVCVYIPTRNEMSRHACLIQLRCDLDRCL